MNWNQVVTLNWNWVVNITGICTNTSGSIPNDVVPGFYFWDGIKWCKIGASSSNIWAVGEERSFVGTTSYTNWSSTGTTKTYMIGKNAENVYTYSSRLLSEAEGSTANYLTLNNGMRLDFWYAGHRPVFVNTTSSPITYNIVTWSTISQYYNGTKTTIAPNAISYAIDGDNVLALSNNDVAEADHGYITFSNGEWYSFSFYLVLIDNIIQGYFTAKRLR